MYEIINPVSFNADTESVNVFCSGSKNTSPNNYFFSIRGNSNRNPVYSWQTSLLFPQFNLQPNTKKKNQHRYIKTQFVTSNVSSARTPGVDTRNGAPKGY